MEYSSVVTVDPGLHTGIAIHRPGCLPEVFVINVNKKCKTIEEKIIDLRSMFSVIMANQCPESIEYGIIEGVQMWGSAVSHASAAKGNLFLLAYIVGMLYSTLYADFGIESKIVEPTKWKGQLTEDALREWVLRRIRVKYSNPHILSAVGLGVLTKGKLW